MKGTDGGKYDPNLPFAYFIAGKHTQDTQHPNLLIAVNEVESAKDLDALDRSCDERRVLLDSGIFNLAMSHARAHGTTHDEALSLAPEEIDGFEPLWDRYGDVVTRFKDRLWGVIELDQGGVANKPRIRQRIETEFGIIPMPVYHPLLDGWEYYDTLAGEYDRLCVGNLVKASPPVRLRLLWTIRERSIKYPALWHHLLGATPNENALSMTIKGSCDSSSWCTGLRWFPAWKAPSMAKMVTKFPPTMWYVDGGDYSKGHAVCGLSATALQLTLDSLVEDTHPCL